MSVGECRLGMNRLLVLVVVYVWVCVSVVLSNCLLCVLVVVLKNMLVCVLMK